jgi:hypothetical protein
MQPNEGKPPVDAPDGKDGRQVQAEGQSDTEPFAASEVGSAREVEKASEDLKTRIAEAKRRNAMPVDSALGNPGWEQDAADGRFDRADADDES